MLRGEFPSASEATREELRAAYDDVLAATIDRVGVETVLADASVDQAVVRALQAGESPDIDLRTATAILATDPDRPDAETLLTQARDILLMGMSAAILDVEALASGIEDELEPKEIQQKIEGRYPISLDEYALLHAYIEEAK